MKKVLINARKEDYANLASILEEHHHLVLRQDPVYEVKVFLPDSDLDAFIDEVRETIDLRYKENLIEVSSPEFVISPYLKRAEEKAEKTERTPIEKLVETTRPYLRLNAGTLAMTSIAGLIALTGLFLNNVAVIIGAMLLSPILGPIYAFAISVAVGRGKDGLRSLSVLAALLLSVFVLSALTTAGLHFLVPLAVTPEILSRTVVSPIYILMAVLLGFAAVLALDRGMSDLIAGVAIAAALLPPTVVAGIATVLLTDRVLLAGVLVLENVVGMLAGALIATLVLGIGAREYYEQVAARKAMARTALAIALLLAILLGLSLSLT
ncbi:TIGR00341 family protein [Methanofollis aquaemaris]|uniref:TIGR00341 family protein n=1 Tax=Methanofollis aquaemaris TaxID=126734 RepID=A0A8A3S7U9_9EURY|nr:TIGR00341 family protein [Methanofollis aquaemaris]QSZ68205.1 TIGR00341 family protein [Methanofollis aquaemaris]